MQLLGKICGIRNIDWQWTMLLQNILELQGTVWFFYVLTLLGFLWAWFLLPETAGKNLEETNEMFAWMLYRAMSTKIASLGWYGMQLASRMPRHCGLPVKMCLSGWHTILILALHSFIHFSFFFGLLGFIPLPPYIRTIVPQLRESLKLYIHYFIKIRIYDEYRCNNRLIPLLIIVDWAPIY